MNDRVPQVHSTLEHVPSFPEQTPPGREVPAPSAGPRPGLASRLHRWSLEIVLRRNDVFIDPSDDAARIALAIAVEQFIAAQLAA
jgi:hypothetical protein